MSISLFQSGLPVWTPEDCEAGAGLVLNGKMTQFWWISQRVSGGSVSCGELGVLTLEVGRRDLAWMSRML